MSGVPSSATAVTGNLTVTGQTGAGYLYIGPVAMNNPTSSTLNFPAGDDRANNVSVALGIAGTLSITFVAPAPGPTAHAIFDVTGYYTPDMTGSTYHAVTPARLLDSRTGTGGISGPVGSHEARSFAVTGTSGVPADATAVTGNLTVTAQTRQGYLYIGPSAERSDQLHPQLPRGRPSRTASRWLSAPEAHSGSPSRSGRGNTAYVIFDVTGYFTPDSSGAAYPRSHRRASSIPATARADSRVCSAHHSARTFAVIGHGGVPSGATAVTGNLTVTSQTSLGYLFIGPTATNEPTSSTLNFPVGTIGPTPPTSSSVPEEPLDHLRSTVQRTYRSGDLRSHRVLRAR